MVIRAVKEALEIISTAHREDRLVICRDVQPGEQILRSAGGNAGLEIEIRVLLDEIGIEIQLRMRGDDGVIVLRLFLERGLLGFRPDRGINNVIIEQLHPLKRDIAALKLRHEGAQSPLLNRGRPAVIALLEPLRADGLIGERLLERVLILAGEQAGQGERGQGGGRPVFIVIDVLGAHDCLRETQQHRRKQQQNPKPVNALFHALPSFIKTPGTQSRPARFHSMESYHSARRNATFGRSILYTGFWRESYILF